MALFAIIAAVAAVATFVVSLVVRSKAKRSKPDEMAELRSPSSGEGKHVMVVYGSPKVTAPNIMAYMDKRSYTYRKTKTS